MKPIAVLLPLVMLTACQTPPSVIDAGCTAWGAHQIKPSRQDTPFTQRGLHTLNEAMSGACPEMAPK